MSIPPEFLSGAASPAVFQRTTYGDIYDFDFSTGQFIDDGSGPPPLIELLTGTASLLQGVEKIWRTSRYTYLAYDGSYGSDVISIAQAGNANADLLLDAISAAAIDGAMSDPRVQLVTGIDLTLDDPNNPTSVEIQAMLHDIFGVATPIDVTITL